MKDYREEYQQKLRTVEQAAGMVRSGDSVLIGFVSSVSCTLANALWDRREHLEDVRILSSNCLMPIPLFADPSPNPFSVCSPFLGPWERVAEKNGRPLQFTSFHLSEVDLWVREIARPTVAYFAVSPPDDEGYMSYGPTGCCVNEYAKETADRIIVHVNRKVPYVTGRQCRIHVSEVDAVVEADEDLPELPEEQVDETTRQISGHIMELIPDGATIQLGIGKLSTAIGYGLRERNDLGIHSELLCEPMLHLIRNGNVTNEHKGFMDGKSVFSFAMGSRELYRFMDHNEELYGAPFPWVNDPRIIARNRRMISINSAMAIDLYGQVAADSMGWTQHSAVGGQVDFVKGAQWSEEGKSVIATASSFMKQGRRQSKIVLNFPTGTAVTTSRSDVQYIATEYGCVNLKALNMADRVKAMIGLAHPEFRAQLTDEARDRGLIR